MTGERPGHPEDGDEQDEPAAPVVAGDGPTGDGPLSRLARTAFPGARAVWIAAAVVAVLGVVLLARFATASLPPLTGTNSVDAAAVVGHADKRERVCVRDLEVPAGSARVQVWMGFPEAAGRPVSVTGVLRADGLRERIAARFDDPRGDYKTIALPRPSGGRELGRATLCLRSADTSIDLGGASVQRLRDRPLSDVGGKPLRDVDVAVRWLEADGRSTSVLDDLGTAFERATTFKSGTGGAVLLWLVLLGFLVVGYLVVRTAATVERRSIRDLALRAAAFALFGGIAWALLMPPFFGADESEHFAYAQHLAETGQRADRARGAAPAYSTEQALLMGALHHNSTILSGGSRPRWDDRWSRAFERQDHGASRRDGGGYSESATGHSPLYYGVIGLPYRALRGALDLPQTLVAMRIFNALFASIVAALAVLIAALMLPRVKAAWWVAGTITALQPVFSSISGTVNNDTFVNLFAALCLLLLLDGWRNGPRPWRMAALGIVTLLLPLAKITGFALWPVVALGALVIVLRHRDRTALGTVMLIPAAMAVGYGIWAVGLSPLLGGGTGTLVNTHPAEGSSAATAGSAAVPGTSRSTQIDYLVQMFLPFVHLTGDHWTQKLPLFSVYVERGWGEFGWFNAKIGDGLIRSIGVALGIAWALAAATAWRLRHSWREWGGGALILLAAVASVVTFVAVAYATEVPRAVIGEQGRYIFPALAALSTIVAAGVGAFRVGAVRSAYVGVICAGMPVIAVIGWLSAVRDWYL